MPKPDELIAHSSNLKLLKDNYNNNFPHSWIFNGIKGIGKYKTAINFIQTIHNTSKNYNQHVFEINSDEKLVLLDDIRNLISQISLTNADSDKKCFIVIDNANLLNFNSFNALLKTIEEPPENTILFIICHDKKRIPKTILSRCISLDFKPLTIDEIKKYCVLNEINLANFDLENNSNLIGGSIEKLLLYISDEGIMIKNKLEKIINSEKLNIAEFESFFEMISKDVDKNFKIISNYIYSSQRSKYLQNINNKVALTKILKFFKNIEIFTKQDLNIDKKKELHFLITEYIDTNVHE